MSRTLDQPRIIYKELTYFPTCLSGEPGLICWSRFFTCERVFNLTYTKKTKLRVIGRVFGGPKNLTDNS